MSALDLIEPVEAGAPARRRQRRVSGTLLVGGVIVGLVIGMALLSFVWTPHDPTLVNSQDRLSRPSAEYWFGTDKFGRDVFSQILVGSRTTLFVGFVAVGVAAVIGVPLGILAGMAPRWLGELVMRANDLLLAFPALLLAIMFAAVYGGSTFVAMVAIGVRHVLPNVSSLVIIQGSIGFAIAVLAEAALSFLGFGTPPPTPSWGRMLQESQELLFSAPRLAVFPGVAIALAVLGFNLLGDGLRDRFDPKLQDRR